MQQNNLIKVQAEIKNRPNSRQRLNQLKKQQQNLSQVFKINNFYHQSKFDIAALKKKIGEYKFKIDQVKDNPQQIIKVKKTPILVPLTNRIQKLYGGKKSQQKESNNILAGRQTASSSRNKKNSSALSGIHLRNRNSVNSSYEIDELKTKLQPKTKTGFNYYSTNLQKPDIINSRYQSIDQQIDKKSHNLNEQDLYGNFRSNIIPKIQNIGRRQNLTSGKSDKRENLRKLLNSSRLQPLSSCKKKLNLIKVQNEQQLKYFQENITTIWTIYQKLSQITKTLSYCSSAIFSGQIVSQQFIKLLCSYKQIVCSTKLQFMIEMIDNCLEFSHAKTLILSRLLQNLSVVYVFLQIVQQATANKDKMNSSHLVNFVGLSSNNLLLTLRLITLISVIDEYLTISQDVINIFNVITEFQSNSYRSEIISIKDVIMRIQHNNQLILIIQTKLNNKMSTKEYHKSCFAKFIKGVFIDRLKQQIHIAGEKGQKTNQTKPFFEYSYFIFQYLAFHLHHQQYLGLFPKTIQTAPEPYLPLKKQFTIIMDPDKILMYAGKEKVYIRAYADKFLSQLNQKCNIVFWSDKMPNQIDSLYDLVEIHKYPINSQKNQQRMSLYSKNDSTDQIKRLYKHHCFYDYNCKGQISLIKDMSRVSCIDGKYIILDSNLQNYYPGEQNKVILLPWKGEAKDSKLSTLLDFLLPFFRQGTDLNKGMALLKPRLQQLLKIKRRNLRPSQT